MKIKVKDLEVNLELNYYDKNRFYEIVALNENSKVMGSLSYKIDYGYRKAWLNKISTEEEFQHKGVGQLLLNAFEYLISDARINCVEGKFYPENDFALPFYQKNDYKIEKDGYETILFKSIDTQKIKEQFSYFKDLKVKEAEDNLIK